MVEDTFVCCDIVRNKDFVAEEAEIADEWRFRVFSHPLDIHRSGRWSIPEIYKLTEEEVVVLVTG